MENEWPPVTECAQYQMGLIQPYLQKQEWEDRDDLSDSQPYDDHADPFLIGTEMNMEHNTVGMAKRFLHQVRTSRGYDVDCDPPPSLESPFEVKDVDRLSERYAERLRKKIQLAIDDIEWKTGKRHEFVKLLKVVWTTARTDLLTFTAREAGSSADPQTFVATVFLTLDGFGEVCECMLKPQGPAPTDGLMSSTCR